MAEILYLAHRLPYPPNKGDKIRSYHVLRYLASHYEVHLGCFVDDKDDEKYIGEIGKYCKSTFVRVLNPFQARAKSIKGLVSGDALTLPYYFDKSLAQWIDDILNRMQISAIVAFSSPMGQYVLGPNYRDFRRIMDFVDIDSDKWRQYAKKSRIPMKWIYSREATLLSAFERRVTNEFDAVVFVSQNETDTFSQQHPEAKHKLFTVCNGVATDYFNPELDLASPFDDDAPTIVFTGMMNYWPNIDAMCWFAKTILPETRKKIPNAELWIVGASPSKEISELSSIPGVNVTGKVPDVRPYLKHAGVVIAPLRIARGVQNKVLEALAMNRPVICTPQAAAGLSHAPIAPIRLAKSGPEFVDCLVENFQSEAASKISNPARRYVLKHYNWERNLSRFDEFLLCGRPPAHAECHVGISG